MTGFSGYVAIDELYDGPFCILSIVDNHSFKRLYQHVQKGPPSHADIHSFLSDFRAILDERSEKMLGVTTDGKDVYPANIARVFPEAVHQNCRFHVIQNITNAMLYAVAKVRKNLLKNKPKLPRGRPTATTQPLARKALRIQAKITALYEHRHLFVRRELTRCECIIVERITRGLPVLRRLRGIMDAVYQLFDRRCRMQTALKKLSRLRARVKRFSSIGHALQTLMSSAVDRTLFSLDHPRLPATSNAVERGNRRYRKMQKAVYRVRTLDSIRSRLALDVHRDMLISSRAPLVACLHYKRQLARTFA
jgi:hypothetical protein